MLEPGFVPEELLVSGPDRPLPQSPEGLDLRADPGEAPAALVARDQVLADLGRLRCLEGPVGEVVQELIGSAVHGSGPDAQSMMLPPAG